ncbi:hypothetical protein [Bdellovibrio sp. HCB337]|uniref:hypothetical protein n=1 Tax=Bdellovibrio sp. HCB337 TaxID=3394358 RepID=UPI0039A74B1E
MKKFLIFTFVVLNLLGVQALAQSEKSTAGKDAMAKKRFLLEKGIEKWLITVDYDSWFEELTVTNTSGGMQSSQALYYGFGLGLEKNWYHGSWGWGLGGGVLGGSAVGGDKSGSLTYFQARVPWYAARFTPRVFYRWTGRTDLGLDISTFYKQSKWNTLNDTVTVTSGSEMITGAFLDLRVRFNPKLEMIQSFGTVYKNESIYWRLGLAYRL